ncbi:MAG: biosynthetic-type acetolactate synthase large subunit [Clostridiaceae bacterium]
MVITGAELVMEILLEQGVNTIFGYPGGAALNIYDALYKYSNKINHYLFAHEQGASHAADGYARATGKTGVVIATSGPGATNLVTGIATAYMDSIPLVAITCNVPSDLIGRDSFQEVCITGITMPVTKHNYFVKKIEDLPSALREAFKIANSSRKGPVLVDITKDVTAATIEYERVEPLPLEPLPELRKESLVKVAEIINNSKRPVLYIGGGALDASREIRELMEKVNIPGTYTIMGAGTLEYENPYNLGLIGMHGSVTANMAVEEADLVITLGARFSDRVALNSDEFAKRACIIHVDIDKSEFNKNVDTDVTIKGDVKTFIRELLPLLKENTYKEWNETIKLWKSRNITYDEALDCSLKPKEIMDTIAELAEGNALYVTDVGQHQMWAAQYLPHREPHTFLTSGGLGTMGFGYGAAIGAKIGCPDKRVIHITGDGSFHMNLNEGCTAVSYDLPIITVILNNKVLGMVYQWQKAFYEGRFSQTTPERKTDFVKLGEGYGVKGYRAENLEELKEAFKSALQEKGPVWIECIIDREERVLPMIPSGGTLKDVIID